MLRKKIFKSAIYSYDLKMTENKEEKKRKVKKKIDKRNHGNKGKAFYYKYTNEYRNKLK